MKNLRDLQDGKNDLQMVPIVAAITANHIASRRTTQRTQPDFLAFRILKEENNNMSLLPFKRVI